MLVSITATAVICWDDQCCLEVAFSIQTDDVAFLIDHIFFLQFLFKLICANVLHFNNFYIHSVIRSHIFPLGGGWLPCSGRRSVDWLDIEITEILSSADGPGVRVVKLCVEEVVVSDNTRPADLFVMQPEITLCLIDTTTPSAFAYAFTINPSKNVKFTEMKSRPVEGYLEVTIKNEKNLMKLALSSTA